MEGLMLKKGIDFINEYFSLGLRIVLILSIINAGYSGLWHIMSTNLFLLILLLIPLIVKRSSRIIVPREFEFMLLLFVIITFFLDESQGIIVAIFFGIAAGLIGFLILFFLYSDNQIKKDSFLISLFSFNFAVSFGFGLEFIKYYLKIFLGHDVSGGIYTYAMTDMTFVILGALISSTLGYIYMSGYKKIFSKIIERFEKVNPHLFSEKNLEEKILKEIKEGEKEKLEFKSTLRVNIFTGELDKKVEYSVLKTIVAFLNSEGGTLLIGVRDKGEIIGIEKDRFENKDKFSLHLMSLIKQRIGNENIPLISTKIIEIDNKNIMRIECLKSKEPVFLKTESGEEFYIRAGPSSAKIEAKDLLEYVNNRFKRNKKEEN
ncbi:MAG: ATP-binding protein [archaeon]